MKRTRRELLSATGVVLAATGTLGLSGCLDFAAGDGPQGPDGIPDALTCASEGFVRLDAPFSEPIEERTAETSTTTIELSTESTSETYGSALRLALRNSGTGPVTALGEHAYAIQRETTEGWVDVRGSTTGEAADLPLAEETLEPNDGYSWSLTLRESAIADAVPDVELDVCPPLGAGTHRFVYWGIDDAPPVGIVFELVG
ncbi:hypothetical protein [Halorubrum sp. DTA98]|uniref:hypothetical protein n=1 Tax=Halorubrum sp. DTA98 TaxID=3402163 RepID=UPI003AAB4A15